ncbi:MAG: TIGR01212 family radical SAM protein [Acidaminococcaceae bacterium]
MTMLYNNYSTFLKQKYGCKVYKLPISIPVTCPNRDGTCGSQGCSFCGEIGAGYENLPATLSVQEQIMLNKEHIIPKYKAEKFIAYFQNFTNTYLPLAELKTFALAACQADVVRLAFATRPDAISDEYLAMLAYIKNEYRVDISLELGLQTVNYHLLEAVRRGHSLAEYLDALQRINKYGLESCTHVILNLPGSDRLDVIETAKVLSAMQTTEAKLHALYIIKGTTMAEQYLSGELELFTMDEYIERVILFLEYLQPQITLQRLIGRAPASHTEFSNWGTGWWKIKEEIERRMAERGTYQGRLCDYLNGKTLRKFAQTGKQL